MMGQQARRACGPPEETTMTALPFVVRAADYAEPLNVVGEHITVLASGGRTGSYEIFLQEGPEGSGPIPHARPRARRRQALVPIRARRRGDAVDHLANRGVADVYRNPRGNRARPAERGATHRDRGAPRTYDLGRIARRRTA